MNDIMTNPTGIAPELLELSERLRTDEATIAGLRCVLRKAEAYVKARSDPEAKALAKSIRAVLS